MKKASSSEASEVETMMKRLGCPIGVLYVECLGTFIRNVTVDFILLRRSYSRICGLIGSSDLKEDPPVEVVVVFPEVVVRLVVKAAQIMKFMKRKREKLMLIRLMVMVTGEGS